MSDETRKGYLRVNHFHGLRLESEDFETGERYHVEKRKLHNRCLHGWGVVPRFEGALKVVSRRRGDMSVDVSPGYAIDGQGNDLILWEPRIVTIDPGKQLPQLPATAHIVIKYVDEPVQFVVNKANPKFKGHRRIFETVRIDVQAKEPDPEEGVELARILVTADTLEITDARDPLDPGPGEVDGRYVPAAGTSGSTVSTSLQNVLRDLLAELRMCLGELARNGVHAARDMRAAAVMLTMLLETGQLDTAEIIKGLRLLLELAEDLRRDVDMHFPELNGVREWEQWKEVVEALGAMAREARPIPGDIENLLTRLSGAVASLRLASEVKPAPQPKAVVPVQAEAPAEDEPEPEPVDKKAAGAVELGWDELEQSSELPEKIFVDGRNYTLVDRIEMGNRSSELEHRFGIAGAKEDWTTNQSFSYPDGKKVSARGKAHVGGTSFWEIKNLQPGKDVVLAKRIDFVRGDIVTRIEIDGTAVGEWEIRGSDRKHRWRNWLFNVPGDAVKKGAVECRQVAVAADRDINMFGLWFYQAAD
jgi:hypothetical protein